MHVNSSFIANGAPTKPMLSAVVLLTPKEASRILKVSVSWLAKARMRGDGPPFIRIGRSIRYAEASLLKWMNGQQRISTAR